MSEREEQGSSEHDVQGVDTNPDEGNKSIAVDTNERLTHKSEQPDFDEVPDEDLEKERKERLDPDHRPENVEVDNSKRDFNPEIGLFEDSESEPLEEAPFATTEAEESKDTSKDAER